MQTTADQTFRPVILTLWAWAGALRGRRGDLGVTFTTCLDHDHYTLMRGETQQLAVVHKFQINVCYSSAKYKSGNHWKAFSRVCIMQCIVDIYNFWDTLYFYGSWYKVMIVLDTASCLPAWPGVVTGSCIIHHSLSADNREHLMPCAGDICCQDKNAIFKKEII